MFICYETDNYYFFWKPHGFPSTFGKEKSFLDYLEEGNGDIYTSIDLSIYESMKHFIPSEYVVIQNPQPAIQHLLQSFTKEQEYGLLNRLDNDTAGFLYFAKDLPTLTTYRQFQAHNQIEKHYIAQVVGNQFPRPPIPDPQYPIDYPIMHRSTERMIAIKDPKDFKKGRGKEHHVQTFVKLANYDPKTDISTLLVTIHKGIRHQIRVHLASIGFPIIGDPLYGEKSMLSETHEHLHLWSVGFKIVE
jgi:23S rRNA pseudouridine1911/1915/1917 synthase